MTIPAGHRLHAVTGSLPATATRAVTLTLTDGVGRVRAEWQVAPGEMLRWSDLAGVLTDSDWEEAVSELGAAPGQPGAVVVPATEQADSTAAPLDYHLHWV